jgi:hypothetical protein
LGSSSSATGGNPPDHVQCRGGHFDGVVGLLVCEQKLDLSGQTGERFLIGRRHEVVPKAWRVVDPTAKLAQGGDHGRIVTEPVEQIHGLVEPRHHARPASMLVKPGEQTWLPTKVADQPRQCGPNGIGCGRMKRDDPGDLLSQRLLPFAHQAFRRCRRQ